MPKAKILAGDPWTKLDKRVWVCLSSGTAKMMRMDRELYKGVVHRIYRGKKVDGVQHYSFWVQRRSFRLHGHRFL